MTGLTPTDEPRPDLHPRVRRERPTDLPPEIASQLRRAIRGSLESMVREHGPCIKGRWMESAVKRIYGQTKTVVWNMNGQEQSR